MPLGMKSGLAYADSFTFLTRYDGKQYDYIMYKGEKGTKIDLLNVRDTTEGNGSIFTLGIKGMDVSNFIANCKKQLAYFEDVYFNVSGISNDFKIIQTPDWKHSTLYNGSSMHLCLDNVYYPIDFSRLNISEISVPVALNFKITDGIRPIPSREDIIYTPEVKAMILEKIKVVATFFVEKYNEGITEQDDLFNVIRLNTGMYISDTFSVSINQLKGHSQKSMAIPTLKGVEKLDVLKLIARRSNMLGNYVVRGRIKNGTFSGIYNEGGQSILHGLDRRYFYCKERPSAIQIQYLKEQYRELYFIYKKQEKKLGSPKKYQNYHDYAYLLSLGDSKKSDWRQIIKEFQGIEANIMKMFPLAESNMPTEAWLQKRKENRAKGTRTEVKDIEINPKWASVASRGDFYAKFDFGGTMKISGIQQRLKGLVVYGKEEDKEKLSELLRSTRHKCRICLLAERDVKRIQDIKSFIHIDKFMEGDIKAFKRLATRLLAEKLVSNNTTIFNSPSFFGKLQKSLGEDLSAIVTYKGTTSYTHSDFDKTILAIAKKHDYWDQSIYPAIQRVEKLLPKYDFVLLFGPYLSFGDKHLPLFRDVLKYRKVRLNAENYAQKELILQTNTTQNESIPELV